MRKVHVRNFHASYSSVIYTARFLQVNVLVVGCRRGESAVDAISGVGMRRGARCLSGLALGHQPPVDLAQHKSVRHLSIPRRDFPKKKTH